MKSLSVLFPVWFYFLILFLSVLFLIFFGIRPNAVNVHPGGLPLATEQTVSLEVNEGTFMNVDVSHDGATIVFDLLGDIYTLPIAGGAATQLTRGLSWDSDPVWSPDGSEIAYKSDVTGTSNIWVMRLDGTNPVQLTAYELEYISDHEWIGGTEIAVANDSGRSGSIYTVETRLEVGIVPSGEQMRRFSSSAQVALKKNTRQGFQLYIEGISERRRLHDVKLPKTQSGFFYSNNNFALSSDGTWLVYVRELLENGRTVCSELVAADLSSPKGGRKDEKILITSKNGSRFLGLERFAFIGQSHDIVVSFNGKLQRINVNNGTISSIPFYAKPNVALAQFIYEEQKISADSRIFKNIHDARLSPDGDKVVFSVNRKVLQMNFATGSSTPLFEEKFGQFQPTYSPDGSKIAYVTWDDVAGGSVRIFDLIEETSRVLTKVPGLYQNPEWSPDSRSIAIIKAHAIDHLGGGKDLTLGNLQLINTLSRKVVTLVDDVPNDNRVDFDITGGFIHFKDKRGAIRALNLDDGSTKVIAIMKKKNSSNYHVTDLVFSPDAKSIAYVFNGNIYLIKVSQMTPEMGLVASHNEPLGKKLSRNGGRDPRWVNDGKELTWVSANLFHRISLDVAFLKGIGEVNSSEIRVNIPEQTFNGIIALTHARIISMRGDEVIKNGNVIVEGNKIISVGKSLTTEIPEDAFVIDVGGKTIIPGLIDMHAHKPPTVNTFSRNWWSYLVNLSYGVTTIRDPSISHINNYAIQERLQSGDMVGPRLFGAMAVVNHDSQILSFEDALGLARHYRSLGAKFFKVHDSWTREQRQWMAKAAGDEGLIITAHPSPINNLIGYNLSVLQDGFTGVEHGLRNYSNQKAVYDDVKQLVAKSGAWYTPTLHPGRFFWLKNSEIISQDPREVAFNYLMVEQYENRFSSLAQGDALTLKEPRFIQTAKDAHDMLKLGARVAVGSHGDYPGRGFHWEMWTYVMAGFTPHEALHAATLTGAEGLGLSDELGSLEEGKIADLLILNSNPLENIENSVDIEYVMKDGKMYEADTLDMVYPEYQQLPPWKYVGGGAENNRN